MLPLNTNIRLAYSNGKDDEQNFIQNLSLFLCTFLKEHGQLVERRPNLRESLMEVRAEQGCQTGLCNRVWGPGVRPVCVTVCGVPGSDRCV